MRTINLNKEFYGYLTNEIKSNNNLNEVDKTIASYLMYLEQTRISRNENDNDYIYPSYDSITKATNVKARQTIVKTINKLLGIGIILKLVKGSVKDGANRYWMNKKYLNQDMITPQIPINVEYRSVENNDNSQILRLLVEIQSEVKSLRKENQELKNEIREMKEMMLKPQSEINVTEVEEQTDNSPVKEDNVIYRSENFRSNIPSGTILWSYSTNNPTDKEIKNKVDDIFNRIKPSLPETKSDEDDELEMVLHTLAHPEDNADEPIIEPMEETPVFTPTENKTYISFTERQNEIEKKYETFSYIYEKPLSKLHSEKEIRNEIEFRNSINKPLYDLQERLKEVLISA